MMKDDRSDAKGRSLDRGSVSKVFQTQ